MKKIIMVAAFLSYAAVFAQFSVNVESSSDFAAKEAILYTLNGSKDIIAGKENRKGNSWTFKVTNRYVGKMKLYFPDTNSSVTLISENKDVKLKLEAKGSKVNDVQYLDESNILMERIQDNQRKNELIFPALVQIKDYYKKNSEFGAALDKEIRRLGEKTNLDAAKNPFVNFYHSNYNKFLVEQSVQKPATTEDLSNFISSSGEMLESSSLLRPVLVAYLNSGSNLEVDKRVDALIARLNVESPRGQTVLSELIEIFDLYAMTDLKTKYLNYAKNLKCTIHDRLASTLKSNADVELGAVFPDYKFSSAKNTSSKSIHQVKASKKVIVFWSSTCSHCEKELPVLLERYNSMKSQGIEVIGLSLDENKDSYEKRVATLPWINDTELRGWNSSYAETYNVHATPTYFVLDASNKIIGKPDHASDVIAFLNLK